MVLDPDQNCLQNVCKGYQQKTKVAASKEIVNTYKPSILFVGHRQTVQTQFRLKRTLCPIRVSTICLQNVLLKFE